MAKRLGYEILDIRYDIPTNAEDKIVLEDEVGAEQVVFTPVPQTFEHIG